MLYSLILLTGFGLVRESLEEGLEFSWVSNWDALRSLRGRAHISVEVKHPALDLLIDNKLAVVSQVKTEVHYGLLVRRWSDIEFFIPYQFTETFRVPGINIATV